jgi:large subunit ribosomal protein L10
MPNLVNRLILKVYGKEFAKAEGAILCSLGGVTVKELEKIRRDLAKEGAKLRMLRNALARRAFAERGFELTAEMLAGNVGVAYGSVEATIHAARVLTAPEIKKAGKIALRGAIFDRQLIGSADAVALANLPDKLALRAQLVGCIQGPLRGLAATLNGVPSGLARVLQAHADKGSANAGA